MLFPDLAYAAASPPGGGAQSMLPTIIMIASMLAIFYFLLLRPQQKQKQDRERMLASIKKGDRVAWTEAGWGATTAWNDTLTVVSEFSCFERRDDDQAAGRFKLVMTERRISQLRDDAVRQGLETIRNRVDQFGVSEPTITRQG